MVTRVVSDLIDSNVFVVGDEKECVIVDSGAKVDEFSTAVGERKVMGVLLTHGHYDHSYRVLNYVQKFGCKVYGSVLLKEYLQNADYNYSEGQFAVKDFSAFEFLGGASGTFQLGSIEIEYTQLGGHSKSDMCYKIGDDIFVGDVLIGRDMGRIDLYGGDKNEMKKSLQFLQDENYVTMHSGHGADNTKATQDKVCALWTRFLSR